MRILLYALLIPGARRSAFVRRLEEVQENGHEIVVMTSGGAKEELTELDVRRVPSLEASGLFTYYLNVLLYLVTGLFYGLKLHREEEFDLVRADFAGRPGFAAGVFSLVTGLPFVLYCQGRVHLVESTPARIIPYLDRGPLRRYAPEYWMARFALATANTVFTVSGLYGDFFERETEVLYPSVDVERYRAGEKEDRMISVAALMEIKNLEAAIEAYDHAEYGEEYLVVGDGPLRKQLEQLHPDVRFAGMQDSATVAEYLSVSKIFVLPSFYETFGVAYLEALAAGCPIVCGQDTGIAEVIEDGVHGVVVDPESVDDVVEAIQYIDNNFAEMSDAARDLAKSFAVEQSANDMIERYEKVVRD